MYSVAPKDLTPAEVQQYLQHAIAPRPICLASTIDKAGNVNLSPFSFFNLFSSNPPIAVFSPARRVRDNTSKHTLDNVLEVPEVVINIVDYPMVQQVSLSSCEYAKGVNEFEKAGFTMQSSLLVKPPMVKESKIKLECLVQEVKPLGTNGGAGNLVICEVVQMHMAEEILDANKQIDQLKMQHVARLGGDWYCVVDESNLFQVEKPNRHTGIGFDQLPVAIRSNPQLNANQLAQLANTEIIPLPDPSFTNPVLQQIQQTQYDSLETYQYEISMLAANLLNKGKVNAAWQVLLRAASFTNTNV